MFLFSPEWQHLSCHLLEVHFIGKRFNRPLLKLFPENQSEEDGTAEKRYHTKGARNIMKETSQASEPFLKKLTL